MNYLAGVLWLSVFLQLVAVVLALKLIPVSKKALAWIALSFALFLMTLRRTIGLMHESGYIESEFLHNYSGEIVALLVSVFMVLGVFLIRNIFLQRNQNERKLQSLLQAFEQSSMGIIIADAEFEIEFVNQRFKDRFYPLLKQKSLEMEMNGLKSLIDTSEDETGNYNSFSALCEKARTGEMCQGEICVRDLTGKTLWQSISISPVKEDNKIKNHTIVFEDITKRKNADEKLYASSRLLDGILENVPNMIFLKEAADLRFNYINRAGEELLGIDRSELLGRNDYDLFPKQQADFFTGKDKEVLAKHDMVDIEEENIETANGTRILHTKKITLRSEDDKPQYLLGISEDITEQKQAEQKLRAQAEIIDQIHDAVVSTDLEGIVTSWNKGAERLFGYSSEEMLGRYIAKVYPVEEHDTLREDVIAPLKAKGFHGVEVCMQRKSGEVFYAELSLAMVFGEQGNATGMIGYSKDITDRKLAEEALIASEERLRMINSHVSGIVYQFKIDVKGRRSLPYVSPTIEKYIGLSAETVMNDIEEWLALTHPDDLPRLEASILESMENMSRWQWEGRFISTDGKQTWLSGASIPIKSFDGSTLWNGVFTDVTARRQAEEALKESEAHLKRAQEMTRIGHWKLNPETGCIEGSDELFNIYGLSREQMTLDSFTEVVHPDDREMVKSAIQRGVTKGASWDSEYRLVCRDGKERWVHSVGEAVTNENGNVIELLGTVQDVTQRAQIESIFRAMAEGASGLDFNSFLQGVLDRLTELYDCDYAFAAQLHPDGQHAQTLAVRANGVIADNFEYSLVGTPCQDILDKKHELIPKYASQIYPEDKILIGMGVESYFGAPLIASDGSIIGILSVMDNKEMNLDEWTTPVLGIFAKRVSLELEREYAARELQQHRDHLEDLVHRRTEDMKAARDEAQRANAAKSEFLSRMSHELRTPMNAILGFSQLLELDRKKLTEEQHENIKEIIDAGHHLLVLIDEVLDLAKIESGKMEITLDDVSVDELLKQSLALVDSQASANGIEIIDSVSGHGVTVRADFTRLKQVLLNLLSNAVKYNCEKGQIRIENKYTDDQRLRICITDTGAGISDDAVKKLFVPFERLGADSTVQGTGIGLVITKHLVEKMGGTIGVESSPGNGSTFWIELALSNVSSVQQKASY